MRNYLILFLLATAPVWAQEFQLYPDRERESVSQLVSETALEAYGHASELAVEKAKQKPVEVAAVEEDNATAAATLVAAPEIPSGGRKIQVRAYAYCLNGRTASGTYVKRGTIAVDPRIIPLGSKIYVPGYGWGKALDTGGAIKGNKIDLWMRNSSRCYNWGVRNVTITVFD